MPRASGAGPDAIPRSLFLVERWLPKITKQQLAMLDTALADVTRRFTDRGENVRYVRSTFLPRQARLLTLFEAASSEVVQAVNDVALVPFTSIEPALEMPSPGETSPA